MSQSSRVTVKDVARAAGVSPGTVSNALSRKRPVSEETRQRVLDVIAELGYRPNLLARGLVNRQSGTLAVVAAGLEYYGPSRTLVGIEQQASELGYTLFLDLIHEAADDDIDKVLDTLTAHRVDGIIWAVHEIGDNRSWIVEERLRQLPPLVFLTMEPRPGLSVLSTDNQRGAVLATEHLLAEGNRKVGIITGPLDWWEARQRLEGWRTALLSHGMDPDDSLIYEGNWSAASGQTGMNNLMEAHPDLDAIFACNDQMAIGVFTGSTSAADLRARAPGYCRLRQHPGSPLLLPITHQHPPAPVRPGQAGCDPTTRHGTGQPRSRSASHFRYTIDSARVGCAGE